ncbi:MAG: hypothetical protein HYU75_05625, partial [Betaproteobacteria bacterium]|nr:hypothetical protein [Betaproteobacteria bacterium]
MANCNCDNVILTSGGDIRPTGDGTAALNIANAAGTDFVTFDTTNQRVAIGTTSPGSSKLAVNLSTAAASDNNGIDVVATQTAAVGNTLRAIRSRAVFSGTTGTQTGINGLDITVEKTGTGGTISFVNVISPWATVSAGSTISTLKMLS